MNDRRTAHRRRDRRGAIIVLAAGFLVVSIAFLAFAIDLGHIAVSDSELQNAVDSAALSGARALPDGRRATVAAAGRWAAKNVTAGDPVTELDVEIGFWNEDTAAFEPLAEDARQNPNAVRVVGYRTRARGNPLALLIAPMIGTHSADLTAVAIARINPSRCGVIIGLESVAIRGASRVDSFRSTGTGPKQFGDKGHVCSNGDIRLQGAVSVRGDARPGPGHAVVGRTSRGVSGSKRPLKYPMSFPPVDTSTAARSNQNASIPLSDGGQVCLQPDGRFALGGRDGVTLSAGTYYFTSLDLSGGAELRVSGPVRIFVAGDCNLSGNPAVNPTRQTKDLQLFVTGDCRLSGNVDFHGALYAPTGEVDCRGSVSFHGSVVAGDLNLTGSVAVHADESFSFHDLGRSMRRVELVR